MTDATLAFLIGSGRCGSTIVGQALARHEDVGFVSNLDDRLAPLNLAGRFNNRIYRALPQGRQRLGGVVAGVTPKLGITPSEGYRLLDRQVSPMLSAPCRDLTLADAQPWLAGRLREFFVHRARAQGRQLFVHKFTGWPRSGLLHEVFPGARFIHIVRDGRAVAASLLQQPWWAGYGGPGHWTLGPLPEADAEVWAASGRSFAVLAALEWKLLMQAFADARAAVPAELWLELRYEDLVDDPRRVLGQLLAHLNLAWTEMFEAEFRRIPWRRDRRDSYRRDLAPSELEHVERVLEPTLRRLGY